MLTAYYVLLSFVLSFIMYVLVNISRWPPINKNPGYTTAPEDLCLATLNPPRVY